MNNLQVILTFISQISWPLVTLFCVLYFYQPISNFLNRLTKVGPSGAEATPPKQSADKVNKKMHQEYEVTVNNLEPVKFLEPLEAKIYRDIVDCEKNYNFSEMDIREHLVRFAALQEMQANCFSVARYIFGTQISLLRHLKDGKSRNREALYAIYDEHEARLFTAGLGDVHTSFGQWISYLIDLQLVELQERGYVITDFGQFFMGFSDSNGFDEALPF
ncbi:MAG: hypothetical protein ACRBBN_03405 [Methyloligellaceae bacterium]